MTLVGTYENREKIMIKTWFCSEIAWTEGLKKNKNCDFTEMPLTKLIQFSVKRVEIYFKFRRCLRIERY